MAEQLLLGGIEPCPLGLHWAGRAGH